jgi:hypothetical protein
MSSPGQSVTKYLYRESAAGAAVTGKIITDFTVVAAYRPRSGSITSWAHGSTITDLNIALGAAWAGWYGWTFTLPATAEVDCGIDIKPATGSDSIRVSAFSGEVEGKDLVDIFNAVNQPVVVISGSGTIGQVTPLTLVAKRYRQITFTFKDSVGANIDMTLGVNYTNYVFSTRDKTNQTLTPPKMDQTTGIVAGSGYVTVTILEAASFFAIMPEGASVTDSFDLRYELTADLVAVSGETVPLVQSSSLTLIRREGGT